MHRVSISEATQLIHVVFLISVAGSDPETLKPQPQPRISRRTQTSSAAPGSGCSHTHTVQSNETPPSKNNCRHLDSSTSSTEHKQVCIVYNPCVCVCVCLAGQLPAESVQVSNTADEPDLRNHPPPVLCVKCSSRLRGRSARKKPRLCSCVLTKAKKKSCFILLFILNQCKVVIYQFLPLVVFSLSSWWQQRVDSPLLLLLLLPSLSSLWTSASEQRH